MTYYAVLYSSRVLCCILYCMCACHMVCMCIPYVCRLSSTATQRMHDCNLPASLSLSIYTSVVHVLLLISTASTCYSKSLYIHNMIIFIEPYIIYNSTKCDKWFYIQLRHSLSCVVANLTITTHYV